jgi:mannitol-1-/sugar-/sorbitol-6-/2-deoxyglucose-6-phosphatase
MALTASIFDMDGLLVDSEPLWQEAEVSILGALGVPLELDGCRRTKGMFVNEVARYWFTRYPWSGPEPDDVAVAVVDRVAQLVVEKGTLQPGARHTIELCAGRGMRLAVASSSEYRLIEVILGHFGLVDLFELVHSAEDEEYGKPHPAVFLSAAAKLGVAPADCLVWEDAAAGVLAAKAARMACVAVPEPTERTLPGFAIADAVLASLDQVDAAFIDRLDARHAEDVDPTRTPIRLLP